MAMSGLQSSREANGARGGRASILAIATATPVNCYLQSDFPDFYFRVTNSDHMTELKDKFKRICEKTEIRKRHMCLTEEILRSNPNITSKEFEPSLNTRQEMLSREVPLLGMEAALKAIEEWGQPASDITHLVFATTSGVESPSADCRLAKLRGLRASAARHFVYQQGCFASSAALRLAKDLAENNAGARVLVVSSEHMAVGFSAPSPDRIGMLVGHAIFADGAAAVVVGALGGADDCAEASDTDDAIVSRLSESGLVYSLSPKIPRYASDSVDKILAEALAEINGGSRDWVHPGGPAVLDGVEKKLGLRPEKLWASRHVLSDYGNTRAPAVLFVLDELRRKAVAERKSTTGDGMEWGVMVSFGPGLTIETMVLRSVAIA